MGILETLILSVFSLFGESFNRVKFEHLNWDEEWANIVVPVIAGRASSVIGDKYDTRCLGHVASKNQATEVISKLLDEFEHEATFAAYSAGSTWIILGRNEIGHAVRPTIKKAAVRIIRDTPIYSDYSPKETGRIDTYKA